MADDEARYVDSAREGFLGGFASESDTSKPAKFPNVPPLSFAELSARAKARKAEEHHEKDENDS